MGGKGVNLPKCLLVVDLVVVILRDFLCAYKVRAPLLSTSCQSEARTYLCAGRAVSKIAAPRAPPVS